MPNQDYHWKRFWCPQSGYISPDNSGYMYDSDTEWGKAHNPDLVTLEAIADVLCLVLLGEPGIGKTQEMKNLKSYTEELIDEDDKVLLVDLEDCSEDKLYTNLFKSKIFADWINGTHRLYLFLDSLDQGWLTISRLPTILVAEFRKLDEILEEQDLKPSPLYLLVALQTGFLQKNSKVRSRPNLSRLYLRIVCRAAVFSQAESSFKNLWGNNLESYALTPLRPSDVRIALDAHNLDADACLKEIVHKGLMPLAIKPISLQFLLKKLQRNNGQLPHSQTLADIYLDGCKELCREPKDETRHPLRPISNLEVNQRLIIAARIAAITSFCIRSAIWIGQNFGDYEFDKDILTEELCGQSEDTNSERGLPITKHVIQEVVDTALFSARESGRMGWAHQTYAEFLAVWYLKQHNLSLSRILSLIFLPDGKAIPQLQETIAWLASIKPEVFQEIAKTDPDVLLQSDIATATDIDKATLVESLLRAYDEERLPYRYRFWQYQHLSYPKLPDDLQEYIINSNKHESSRLTAIDTAVCRFMRDSSSNGQTSFANASDRLNPTPLQ